MIKRIIDWWQSPYRSVRCCSSNICQWKTTLDTSDLPSIIHYDGSMWWGRREPSLFNNNIIMVIVRNHDQPSVITSSGGYEWWCDGQPHRDDNAPSMIYDDMYQWHYHGIPYLPRCIKI